MDWLAHWPGDPFGQAYIIATLWLVVFGLSLVLAFGWRRVEWSSAAALAALIGSVIVFGGHTASSGVKPMSVMGAGMMFVQALVVAVPTVGLVRRVLARTSSRR